jgi:small subunit ribosomal protein S7
MPRKARTFKVRLTPDLQYNSLLVAKFINQVMSDGKKTVASNIVYSSLTNLGKTAQEKNVSVLDLFINIIESIKPRVKMKSRRVGGATYQVPKPLEPRESEMIAMKWLIEAARSASGKTMVQALTTVFVETLEGRGTAVKKKEEMHKSAEANKAFAHFA